MTFNELSESSLNIIPATSQVQEEQKTEKPNPYQNSQIISMRNAQAKNGIDFTALISDFDNSYFREEQADATKKLEKITAKYDIPTVIVTGNSAHALMQKIEEESLRKPEIIVGAVGTEIFVLQQDGSYVKDEAFIEVLKQTEFDRQAVVKEALELIENNPNHLDFQKPQEEKDFIAGKTPADQPFKISFYFFGEDGNRDNVEKIIKQKFPRLEVVVCEETGHNSKIQSGEPKKYCVDCLPKLPENSFGGKAGAVNYLQKRLEIKRGFRVGDSGNDERMLKDIAIGEGVVVGGVKPELEKRIGKNATIIGDTGFIRVGEGSERKKYYLDRSGQKAAGSIIEATIKRLQVTLRFEQDPKMRTLIKEVLDDLRSI